MPAYYVNQIPQSNGDHEVHISTCIFLPNLENRMYLGDFIDCQKALKEAEKHYPQSNGCYYCSRECHTG